MQRYQPLFEDEDYRGLHTAPDKTNGSPLYDLTNTYPDDIYSNKAVQYYGHYGNNSPVDYQSINVIHAAKGKPNLPVKIYRAIPKNLTTSEKINKYEKEKAYIMKYGKVPKDADEPNMNRSKYYDYISNQLEKLRKLPAEAQVDKIGINPGDWVTINRAYAKEHGESTLRGHYKILSKTVPAKYLFTDGNSIHEWGYDPS